MSEDERRHDEDLSASIDGQLDPRREAELRAELAASPQAQARMRALSRVDEALRPLPETPVPAGIAEAVRGRITDDLARRRRLRLRWAGGAALAAAAPLALLLILPRVGGEPPLEVASSEPGGSRPELEVVAEEAPAADAVEDLLAEASEEELAIALDYEVLADLDWIEDLELLERMADEQAASGGAEREETRGEQG